MKIVSVKDKRVRKLVQDPSLTAVKGLDAFQVKRIAEQIVAIRFMTHPAQLAPLYPHWKPHAWKGRPNVWSLDVTGNWRLVFEVDIPAQEVRFLDLIDPH